MTVRIASLSSGDSWPSRACAVGVLRPGICRVAAHLGFLTLETAQEAHGPEEQPLGVPGPRPPEGEGSYLESYSRRWDSLKSHPFHTGDKCLCSVWC